MRLKRNLKKATLLAFNWGWYNVRKNHQLACGNSPKLLLLMEGNDLPGDISITSFLC